eukprot:361977-Amorphochlora_amoeboformis.AAC.1
MNINIYICCERNIKQTLDSIAIYNARGHTSIYSEIAGDPLEVARDSGQCISRWCRVVSVGTQDSWVPSEGILEGSLVLLVSAPISLGLGVASGKLDKVNRSPSVTAQTGPNKIMDFQ